MYGGSACDVMTVLGPCVYFMSGKNNDRLAVIGNATTSACTFSKLTVAVKQLLG